MYSGVIDPVILYPVVFYPAGLYPAVIYAAVLYPADPCRIINIPCHVVPYPCNLLSSVFPESAGPHQLLSRPHVDDFIAEEP